MTSAICGVKVLCKQPLVMIPICLKTIPLVVQSEAQVYSHSIAGITGSNPSEGMDVRLLFFCDVKVVTFATGRSLAQRSLTGCVSVNVCDTETSTMRRTGPEFGRCVRE